MQPLKKVLRDTKEVFKTEWNPSSLLIEPWVILTIIYIVLIRSLAYGIELFILVSSSPISPLMAFANIFGIQYWGLLMLVGVAVMLVGVITKKTILVTIGTLISSAVWAGFALCLGFGWFSLGTGGRFFVAAAATASMWITFFIVQLRTIRKNGVGYHD